MPLEIVTITIEISLLTITALVAALTIRATRRRTNAEAQGEETAAADVITDAALKLLAPMTARIDRLEKDLRRANKKLDEALRRIEELQKVEEYLQARLHEKDSEIKCLEEDKEKNVSEIDRLREELASARVRISHLEEVCRRAGLNGDEDEQEE